MPTTGNSALDAVAFFLAFMGVCIAMIPISTAYHRVVGDYQAGRRARLGLPEPDVYIGGVRQKRKGESHAAYYNTER